MSDFPLPITVYGNQIFKSKAKLKSGAHCTGGLLLNDGDIRTETGVGTAADGITVTEHGDKYHHTTVLTLANFPVLMEDEAGVAAHGGAKLYDFPEGAISIRGIVSNLAVTKTVATGVISDTFDGDFAVGTATAGAGATLTGTEADILPSTATPQAVAGATTAKGQSTATQHVVHDGTTTAIDAYLNFAIDDADHDIGVATPNLYNTGTITILWDWMGDY